MTEHDKLTRKELIERIENLEARNLRLEYDLDRIPIGIHRYRLDNRKRLILEESNIRADELLGSSQQGKAIQEAIEGISEADVRKLKLVARGGEPWSKCLISLEEEQLKRVFEMHAFHNGERRCTLTFQDVTQYQRANHRAAETEHRYRSLFEVQTDLIVQLDISGKYLFINSSFLDLFEGSKEELYAKDFVSLIHDDDGASVEEIVSQVLRGKQLQAELRALTRRGVRWLSLSFNPIRNERGEICGVTAAGRDITEKKMVALECAKSERKYRALFEHAGEAIMMLKVEDHIPRVVQANMQAQKLFGFSSEELLGKSPIDLSPKCQPENANTLENMKNALFDLAVGDVYSFDWFFEKKCGELIECNVSITLVETGAEKVYLIIAGDVTERRQMEARLRHSEKMEAVGRLAGGVAHDFNNQLAGIMGYADLICIEADKVELVRDYAQSILSASRHAADLVNKLLAFSQRGQYNPVVVNIHSILLEVTGLLERSIEKNITISRIFNASNSFVLGDPAYLQSAFLNLGINARDAMPRGGAITFETNVVEKDKVPSQLSCDNCLHVRVSDTGVGIKPEIIDRIFEPFFTTKRKGKGTGLGLAAIYETVNKTNGTIEVCSTENEGTCFDIFLPVVQPAGHGYRPKRPAFIEPGKRYRIVVVDDESLVCRAAAMMLKVAGHDTVEFNDPREALTYFRKHRQSIDLVITDMIMPYISGEEFIKRLKDIDRQIKVIASTGYCGDRESIDIDRMGAVGLIKKPFQTKELLAVIEGVMG